jgi:predicted DNA-binding transcriptional regulator AlpA
VSADTTTEDIRTSIEIEKGFVTRAQLARLYGKSARFWWRLEKAGEGPPVVHLGRTPLYRLAAVRDWLAVQEGGAVPRGQKARRRAVRRVASR